jgi:hypothetical protein
MLAVVCLCVLFMPPFYHAPENVVVVLHDFRTLARIVGSGPAHPSSVMEVRR